MILTPATANQFRRLFDADVRVLVDGDDVTDRCFSADCDAGWALCGHLDESGRFLLTTWQNKPAVEVLTGDVRFLLRRRRS